MTQAGDGPAPVMVVCAHGTRDPQGQQVVSDIVAAVRAAAADLPEVPEVVEAFVDVQEPALADVVAGIPADRPVVVVPLLLAAGYHVHHDIPEAVADRPLLAVADALGPDERLVEIVAERIDQAHVPHTATVVLAPAGSSDPRAAADSEATAEMLRLHWDGPVRVGNASDVEPTVAVAVAGAREFGEDSVAIASYLLAPGFFQDKLESLPADVVTGPLAPDARIVEIVLDRYSAARPAATE